MTVRRAEIVIDVIKLRKIPWKNIPKIKDSVGISARKKMNEVSIPELMYSLFEVFIPAFFKLSDKSGKKISRFSLNLPNIVNAILV